MSDRETGESILLFNLALSAAVGTEEAERLNTVLIVHIQQIETIRKLPRENLIS